MRQPCIPLDVLNGLVRCVHPGIDGHVSFGTVLNVDYDAGLMQSYMDVEDLEGRVLNAIKEYGCDLTVLGNYGNSAPGIEPVTSGHWDDIAYDSLTDTTTFTDFSATFPPQAANWWLQPDAARSTYLEILSISASTVTVAGDAEGLAHGLIPQPGPPPLPDIIGTFYTIVWPAGVDPASGTLAHNDPCEPVSRLLFAGYYYMPPVAGTMVQPPGGGSGVHGQQPGGNHHGDYYCWNRVYAQKNGRWTTTDPAKRPWENLAGYVRSNPLVGTDPSGLHGSHQRRGIGKTAQKLGYGRPTPGYPTHNSVTASALAGSKVPWCLMNEVMIGAVEIDVDYMGTRAFHADDVKLLDETAEWLYAVRRAGAHLLAHKDCNCAATLARLAGMAAHTIQDFYHHSNWFYLNGATRWGESERGESMKGIAVGSGWAESKESRNSPWHHDPYGDLAEPGDKYPDVPKGYDGDRLKFLKAMVEEVEVPHTRELFNSLFGFNGTLDDCCKCRGEDYSSSFNHLTECFGDEIGHTLWQFLRNKRGTAQWARPE